MSKKEGSPGNYIPGWEGIPVEGELMQILDEVGDELPKDATYEEIMQADQEIKHRLTEEQAND